MLTAGRISLIYFFIGAVWIIASDSALMLAAPSGSNFFQQAQIFKGWAFMALTSAILYGMLRREFNARHQSEAKVREREARFHDLFANNPVPMWVYDRQTLGFIDVNEAACALYGYGRDEFLTKKITEIRSPEELPRLTEHLPFKDEDFRATTEWRHSKKDGTVMDVETSTHTLDYAGKQAVLVAVQDITERKRAEAERIETEKRRIKLDQEDGMYAMRTRFISMVSHEFRRPLTTITTSIDLLENYRDRMTAEAAQKHFARIHERLLEMQDLLDDFLALMRTEAGQQFKPGSVELTELCAKLVEEVRLSAKASHTIQYTSNCEKIVIDGDEKMLRHAIGNLLSNAVKYSPDGGEIMLDLHCNDRIDIRVSDQGIGIPLKDQANLFDPFYRASNVGELSGTGLGLPIAKQAVELHSGSLSIAKSDASGTEFLISLPL